jgi:hypothetical protein
LNAGKETANTQESKTNLNNRVNKSNQSVTPGPDPSANIVSGDNNPESALVAVQKSSKGLEVQSGPSQADAKHLMVSGQPAKSAAVLAIKAPPNTNTSDYENALTKDQEYQSDNAISVVALNDPNKGISKFFKKLTQRTPEETNARQIRVSVFQISY